MPPLNKFKRFDVREMIRSGVEPFPGEGFASKVERGQGADWLVYFWREAA
jgi:hypothetical protein